MNKRFYTNGISLLEVMLFISISALILVVAVNYYTNVRLTSKINATVLQVKALYKASLFYYDQERYGLLNQNTSSPTCSPATGINAAGLICTLYQGNYLSQTDMISPWGKNTANNVSLTLGKSSTTLKMVLPALPKQACTVIKSRLEASFTNSSTSTNGSNFSASNCPGSGTGSLTLTFVLK